MLLDRRTFLAAGVAGTLAADAAFCADGVVVPAGKLARTICPHCAVGCGALVARSGGKLVAAEGDPQHPVNRGALCAKGTLMVRAATSPQRLTVVRYRAPGAKAWEEKSWDWALPRIIARLKAAPPPAVCAGPNLDNEECLRLGEFCRALGIARVESPVRLAHGSTLAALHATFGGQIPWPQIEDLPRAAVVLVLGGNPAENHPVAMRWILAAKDKGAKLIVVDPRLSRTAAAADLYVPLRAGADVALLGGLICHALANGHLDRDALAAKTDAACLVAPDFAFAEGRFGPLADSRYTRAHWQYQLDPQGQPRVASLDAGQSVFQVLRRHFARYTPEAVAAACGTPAATLRQAAEWLTATAGPDRAAAVFCGQGLAQHACGTQAVRAACILQLLFGNVGLPGGGLHVLGAEANQRGAMELDRVAVPTGTPKETVPLPRSGNRGRSVGVSIVQPLLSDVIAGRTRGLLVVGENPAVTMPDAARFWAALGRLEWLVAMDGYETETATFWRRPGTRPEDIATEVFLLPAAGALEREGRITNAWGMVQSHPALVAPPGQCKTVGWLLDQLSPPAQREKQPGPPPAHALAARTRLFAAELADGPLPEHYEPCESPVANAFSPQQCNPVAIRPQDGVAVGGAAAGEFPIVATIVRIGEHSQSGLATRNLPWLVEMVPGPFVELSKSLAQSRGIRNGQPAAIRTARGEIVLPAVVTGRLRPLRCGDREIEQVAIVGQFGWCGQAAGPTAAVLAPAAFDPNSGTPEMKGFLCEVARGGDWGLGIRD